MNVSFDSYTSQCFIVFPARDTLMYPKMGRELWAKNEQLDSQALISTHEMS